MLNKEQIDEFEKLAKPLIKWLNNNVTPHSMIVIEVDSARVYSGECSIVTDKFIND